MFEGAYRDHQTRDLRILDQCFHYTCVTLIQKSKWNATSPPVTCCSMVCYYVDSKHVHPETIDVCVASQLTGQSCLNHCKEPLQIHNPSCLFLSTEHYLCNVPQRVHRKWPHSAQTAFDETTLNTLHVNIFSCMQDQKCCLKNIENSWMLMWKYLRLWMPHIDIDQHIDTCVWLSFFLLATTTIMFKQGFTCSDLVNTRWFAGFEMIEYCHHKLTIVRHCHHTIDWSFLFQVPPIKERFVETCSCPNDWILFPSFWEHMTFCHYAVDVSDTSCQQKNDGYGSWTIPFVYLVQTYILSEQMS